MSASPSATSTTTPEQRAHEPSMEEILASIRRIIADDQVLPLSRPAATSPRQVPVGPPVPRHFRDSQPEQQPVRSSEPEPADEETAAVDEKELHQAIEAE